MGLFACFSAPQVENGKLEDILEDNYQNGGHGGQIGQMEDVLRNGGHLTRMVETHVYNVGTHVYNVGTHVPNVGTHVYDVGTHVYNVGIQVFFLSGSLNLFLVTLIPQL